MVSRKVLEEIMALLLIRNSAATTSERDLADAKIKNIVRQYQKDYMNAHPSGQSENVPMMDGVEVDGLQHKYKETALWFAAEVCIYVPDPTHAMSYLLIVFLTRHNFVMHSVCTAFDGPSSPMSAQEINSDPPVGNSFFDTSRHTNKSRTFFSQGGIQWS